MLNKVIITGNLTADPILKQTKNSVVCNFRLAQNTYQGKNKDKKAVFVDATAWKKTAEHIAAKYKKGHEITIEGALDYDEWQDDAGNKQSRVFIQIAEVHSRPVTE